MGTYKRDGLDRRAKKRRGTGSDSFCSIFFGHGHHGFLEDRLPEGTGGALHVYMGMSCGCILKSATGWLGSKSVCGRMCMHWRF